MLVKISLLCPNTPPAQLKTPTSPPGVVCIAVPLRTFKKLIICRAHTPGSEIIILTGHTGTHATHHSLDLLMLAEMKRKLVNIRGAATIAFPEWYGRVNLSIMSIHI